MCPRKVLPPLQMLRPASKAPSPKGIAMNRFAKTLLLCLTASLPLAATAHGMDMETCVKKMAPSHIFFDPAEVRVICAAKDKDAAIEKWVKDTGGIVKLSEA